MVGCQCLWNIGYEFGVLWDRTLSSSHCNCSTLSGVHFRLEISFFWLVLVALTTCWDPKGPTSVLWVSEYNCAMLSPQSTSSLKPVQPRLTRCSQLEYPEQATINDNTTTKWFQQLQKLQRFAVAESERRELYLLRGIPPTWEDWPLTLKWKSCRRVWVRIVWEKRCTKNCLKRQPYGGVWTEHFAVPLVDI